MAFWGRRFGFASGVSALFAKGAGGVETKPETGAEAVILVLRGARVFWGDAAEERSGFWMCGSGCMGDEEFILEEKGGGERRRTVGQETGQETGREAGREAGQRRFPAAFL